MYEDLIQRLEGKVFERPSCTPFDCGVFGLVGEAAAAIAALQSENAEKDKDISRVDAERDAANGYLEKIDGMFGTAYPNEILAVLEEWRGAQGEA
jgi:hypothetical protein